jgi:hypothetical protein
MPDYFLRFSMFDEKILINALQSQNVNIAMWGAFRLMQDNPANIEDFFPYLLESPFEDIQETVISKIAELNTEKYIPNLIKIFREEEGRLKFAAALTLSQFPNDFSKTLIEKWFLQTVHNSTSTSLEFEAAIYSFLKVNKQKHFDIVFNKLDLVQADSLKSSLMISDLLQYCETEDDFEKILDSYFIIRDNHSDADLTRKLIDIFGKVELIEWLIQNVSKGYSINSIYQQCYSLLGFAPNQNDLTYWKYINDSFFVDDKLQRFSLKDANLLVSNLVKWLEQLTEIQIDLEPNQLHLKYILLGYLRNQAKIALTIPKILELDLFFLLSIPLIIVLNQCIDRWVKLPAENLEHIARYYHSSLLLTTHREKILSLFFPNPPQWTAKQVQISSEAPVQKLPANRNDILWQFNRAELLGSDISWHSIFPNPNYSKNLAHGLFLIYYHNFDYYIQNQDLVAIDYALQMFNSYTYIDKDDVFRIISNHFDYLSLHHSELLYQIIESLPDTRYIALMFQKFKREEYEIASRIAVICEIFDEVIPETIKKDLEFVSNSDNWRLNQRIRLSCQKCNNTYRYSVQEIFVDEAAVLKSAQIDESAIWIMDLYQCKNCDAPLPFILDNLQLEEISVQSRVERIIKTPVSSQNNRYRYKINLIDFPRYNGKMYNPDSFNQLVLNFEKDSVSNEEVLKNLYIKQILLYRNMQDWEKCKQVLDKLKPPLDFRAEWLFLQGLSCFKLKNLAESRIHFSTIIREFENFKDEHSEPSFLEQARYFCKILDSEKSKRKRFKVIGGGK